MATKLRYESKECAHNKNGIFGLKIVTVAHDGCFQYQDSTNLKGA